MDSTYLGWRALARRQWPLAGTLLFLLVVEMFSNTSEDGRGLVLLAQLPAALVAAVLAVLAPRRPFDAALATAVAIGAGSVLLNLIDVVPNIALAGNLLVSEAGAVMAIIAIVVRQDRPLRAAAATAALVATTVVSALLRPTWWQHFVRDHPDQAQNGGSHGNVWGQLVFGGLLLLISVGTGLYFRARDRERQRTIEAEVVSAQHAERMALARELHDVVAHYVTGIVVHAQAAQAVAAVNPQAASEVLPVITASGTEALTAMRRLVGTLRGADPAGSSSASTSATSDLAADLREVVAQAAAKGQPAHLTLDLPDQVPPELARSVLRLVQEALTNSQKHALGVSRVDVTVSGRDDAVQVLVADDGHGSQGAPAGGSGGYGLVGMRERVDLLGGRFSAGPVDGRGWVVSVELPMRGDRT
ncbi:histidine kinase [Solihabitans fulvus]|uniref:histidine kinase n=1 Tax=Solihabitans fulvus TaxID=1892852 RepID=A0A5B2WLZ8_9PSEU|nr:histidine kinase [Solihabitans fulvus]KAA2251439.1 histidine kinase [Solihabitans fulvus]